MRLGSQIQSWMRAVMGRTRKAIWTFAGVGLLRIVVAVVALRYE
jgi:hypothetical protein